MNAVFWPYLCNSRRSFSSRSGSITPRRHCEPIHWSFHSPRISTLKGTLLSLFRMATQQQHQQSKPPPPPELPLYSWMERSPGSRLVYIRYPEAAELELSQQPLVGPLGFDLEWKPCFVKGQKENPVAVVQLASADRILLIQVSAMHTFPVKLREVLEDPAIVKAGVSILNDTKKLWHDYGVNVSNCVDLGLLARTVDNPHWKGKYSWPIGLSRLCEVYFGQSLAKGKVQRSNWESLLSAKQQEYAANDCHSGWALYQHLSAMIPVMTELPLPSFYSFDLTNGMAFQPSTSLIPVSTRVLWNPHNPFYDPGPPPEKKQKEQKEETTKSEGTASGTQSGAASPRPFLGPSSSASRPDHAGRGMRLSEPRRTGRGRGRAQEGPSQWSDGTRFGRHHRNSGAGRGEPSDVQVRAS
ncbi:ribonuclease H-like domain-containing protein [Cristinia sonorae]|uniref:3'-5' exonuclease n=1 Tax=Cristinia sonorae TaxID=1940300 RepID=A0A8K0UFY8_9AGAR|nr:ribonuclease H-like domain-containing protein [Cristinia sonorae]